MSAPEQSHWRSVSKNSTPITHSGARSILQLIQRRFLKSLALEAWLSQTLSESNHTTWRIHKAMTTQWLLQSRIEAPMATRMSMMRGLSLTTTSVFASTASWTTHSTNQTGYQRLTSATDSVAMNYTNATLSSANNWTCQEPNNQQHCMDTNKKTNSNAFHNGDFLALVFSISS